uniref:Uncharacterized protein n=1 Tax=Chromera velia CCMP2878 TaxID=1169474 RepID=A0A0G4HHI6_9ALVE|eukprot:Cvel_27503.t1-p1 / transcript=Cvel_27503.t1 / gene=Cvel_27503 / organism=Chromera_velia_CCMP2878 / gene_product=hypothetical protein / transcript_product=hypothetical protein / location=Cvel_scaffold3441:11774-12802(+) / protein_length=343 / sequence_SO=supercontig / SO=protein_coding / is_pseudo=false
MFRELEQEPPPYSAGNYGRSSGDYGGGNYGGADFSEAEYQRGANNISLADAASAPAPTQTVAISVTPQAEMFGSPQVVQPSKVGASEGLPQVPRKSPFSPGTVAWYTAVIIALMVTVMFYPQTAEIVYTGTDAQTWVVELDFDNALNNERPGKTGWRACASAESTEGVSVTVCDQVRCIDPAALTGITVVLETCFLEKYVTTALPELVYVIIGFSGFVFAWSFTQICNGRALKKNPDCVGEQRTRLWRSLRLQTLVWLVLAPGICGLSGYLFYSMLDTFLRLQREVGDSSSAISGVSDDSSMVMSRVGWGMALTLMVIALAHAFFLLVNCIRSVCKGAADPHM